jgi:hypothetical protein
LIKWLKNKLSKPDEVVLYCYTNRPDVFYNYPVVKSAYMIPEWFKRLPSKTKVDTDKLEFEFSMKSCAGFTGLFKKGVMMPFWSDLAFTAESKDGVTGSYKWRFADGMTSAEYHAESQRGEYLPAKEYCHLKIESPWVLHCEEDVDWLWQQPVWNQDHPEHKLTLPAVVNYSRISDTNVNIMVPRQSNDIFTIFPAGEPIVQLIPLTERPVRVVCELVTDDQWKEMLLAKNPHSKFGRSQTENAKNRIRCPIKPFSER